MLLMGMSCLHLQLAGSGLSACMWARMPQAYANSKGVRIVGDIPIYVGGQSADVWAYQRLFELDAAGQPTAVRGFNPKQKGSNKGQQKRRKSNASYRSLNPSRDKKDIQGKNNTHRRSDMIEISVCLFRSAACRLTPSARPASSGARPSTTGRCGRQAFLPHALVACGLHASYHRAW